MFKTTEGMSAAMLATSEPATRAIDDVVHSTLQQAGIRQPPVDAFEIAARLGIRVCVSQAQAGRGRLIQLRKAPATILLRDEPRSERAHWTVAHEIGEFLMPEIARKWLDEMGTLDATVREWLANRFAHALLTPSEWFFRDANQLGHDLFDIKARYATASHEVIALRMLEGGEPIIVTVVDNNRVTRRLGNLPVRPPDMTILERRCQRQARETNQLARFEESGICVRAWPVHEKDWKREILRTEIDLDISSPFHATVDEDWLS